MKSARAAKKAGARDPRATRRPSVPLPSGEETWRILEDLPVAVVVATLEENPRLLFLNKQFTKTFGYTLADIPTQQDWARRAYPDAAYRQKVFDRWYEALGRAERVHGSVESMEFRVTAKDGRLRDILFNAIVLHDTIQISLSDLTDRRDAERALQSAHEQLERTAYEVTENIPAGTYTMILPPGGEMARFSFMSSRFLELCGLDRQAAEENPLNAFACVHPDDYDEWVRKNAECFEKKVPFSEECRVISHGVTRWIHAESVPRDLPDGSVVWEGVLTDITRRKAAEAELAAEEARLRKILDNIPVPVALNEARKDGRITFLNEAFTRTFGYTREDLPHVGVWARLAYPDETYREATFRTWDAAVAEAARTDGIVPPIEVRVRAKDGTRRDVIISAAMFDQLLLVGFIDLTERRKAESKLRTARRKLERTAYAVTENIPVGTVALHIDARGQRRYVFTSDRWLEMLGLERHEAMADHSLSVDRIHPEDRAGFEESSRNRSLAEGRFFWEGRLLVNGKVSWVNIESVGQDLGRGESLWWGIMTDITARREAEAELLSVREKLQRSAYELTANIPVGTYVVEFDAAGRPGFTFTSERWLTMLGLRREDVLADPSLAFEAVHPEERAEFQRLNAEVFAKKKPFFWEGRIVVGGRTSWVTIESIPRDRPDGGTIWEGVMTDITRRKTAETELAALREAERKKEQQARENLEAKLRASLTAAAAAHEINQPLGRILLTSQLVREHAAKTPGGDLRISSYLRSLTSEAEHVVATIERMKSLMRNTGTEQAPLDLRDLVDSAVLYAGSFARAAKARITFDRPARRAVVTADADQLQIALNNMLRNAIEAVAELPARRRRDIRVEVRHGKGGIKLVVGDSGPGWPAGTAPDQLPESTKPGGTGLGLFIVRTAAENHSARLETGVSPLGGAEVRLVFPKPTSPR